MSCRRRVGPLVGCAFFACAAAGPQPAALAARQQPAAVAPSAAPQTPAALPPTPPGGRHPGLIDVTTGPGGAHFAPGEVTLAVMPFQPVLMFTAQRDLVDVVAVVRDRDDRLVDGLTQNDFTILDNRVPQKIVDFTELRRGTPSAVPAAANGGVAPAVAPAAPAAPARTVALFFDDYNSPFGDLARARNAAQQYLKEGLPPGESMGVFTASGYVEQDFTHDPAALAAALAKLRVRTLNDSPCPGMTAVEAFRLATFPTQDAADMSRASQQCSLGGGGGGGMIAVAMAQETWDTVEQETLTMLDNLKRVADALRGQSGQRVLLITSSGFITPTLQLEEADLAATAIADGVTINTLDAKGLYAGFDYSIVDLQQMVQSMADLAAATGGQFYTNNNDLRHGFEVLSSAPRIAYEMHFSPPRLAHDGAFHKLAVVIAGNPKLEVQTRMGYTAPGAEGPTALDMQQRLNFEAMAIQQLDQVPATLALRALPTPAPGVEFDLDIDARKLPWVKNDGTSFEQLIVAGVLLTPQGNFAAGRQGILTFKLGDASRKEVLASGIPASMTLHAPPGAYILRAIVEESVRGAVTAFTRQVTVP